ncbi:hypothetical protein CerSpe_079180 [Prunus speciosa]
MEDVYGGGTSASSAQQQQDYFPIDDLLDLSNDDLFSSSTSSTDSIDLHPPPLPSHLHVSSTVFNPTAAADFTNDLCVPSDDVAELEWLSRFVDDSFTDFPTANVFGSASFPNDTSSLFPSRVRTNRSKWGGPPEPSDSRAKAKREPLEASPSPSKQRRCAHCASEKTPQWRAGPMGPKTLCNACGVRFKSGRLVPEYRPAASPTFVLTQHSNSHRKVLELRRQKEASQQQQPEEQHQQKQQFYLHRDEYQVC